MAEGGAVVNGRVPGLPQGDACCGCGACASRCPSAALDMAPDEEGFLHPRLDRGKCTGCLACEGACPVLHVPCEGGRAGRASLPRAYAVQALDRTLRLASSSGGVFTLLARHVLSKGGVVFGVACLPGDGAVRMVRAESEGDLGKIRGSKYVQAEVGDAYAEAARLLASGRSVLFSGTPCQVAAMRLAAESLSGDSRAADLFLVDVVCHSAASPLVWRRFLESVGCRGDLEGVDFRVKRFGWKKYAMSVRRRGGREMLSRIRGYPYLWGFIGGLYSRPSCHRCHFRSGHSGSDVTLGDFWGVGKVVPGMDDDAGTSLVLARTPQGAALFDSVRGECRVEEAGYDAALAGNPSLERDQAPHPGRASFFADLASGADFDAAARKALGMTPLRRIAKALSAILCRLSSVFCPLSSSFSHDPGILH